MAKAIAALQCWAPTTPTQLKLPLVPTSLRRWLGSGRPRGRGRCFFEGHLEVKWVPDYLQLCEHGWYRGGPFDCLHCGGLRCGSSRIPRGRGYLGRAPSMRSMTTEKEMHINRLGAGKMYGNFLWFLCVLQDKGYLFALFHAFTLTSYIPVTISKSPVLSCPLSLVQHGLAPHYRQSKNWSHDRKSLPNTRPREYERLGRAVASHSLCRTPLKMSKHLLSILVS